MAGAADATAGAEADTTVRSVRDGAERDRTELVPPRPDAVDGARPSTEDVRRSLARADELLRRLADTSGTEQARRRIARQVHRLLSTLR